MSHEESRREQIYRSGIGIGQPEVLIAPAAAASPWAAVIVTSVLGAATGWVIEEAANHVKKRRRR